MFLHGFYVYGSWFLTGEHRGYSRERAAFSDVKVNRPVWKIGDGRVVGCGAWELAARFALADFTSPNLPISTDSNVQAGAVLYQATLGINWYLNDHTLVMFNYNLAAPAIVGFPTLPVHVFGVRTAIYW